MARREAGVFDDPLMLGLEDDEPEAPSDEGGQASDPAAAAQQALEGAEDGPDAEPGGTPDQGQVQQEPEADGEPAQQQESQAQQGEGQLILGKFKTPEDLARSYQELERKLGSRDEEKQQLRQQVGFLGNQVMQLLQQMQAIQAAQQVQGVLPTPAQPGQMVQPGQVMQPGVVPQPQSIQAQIDPEEFRDALYSGNPVEAISKLVQPIVAQELQRYGQQINAGLQQMMRPIQQHVRREQAVQSFQAQLAEISTKYANEPEGLRVDDLKDEMSKVFDEEPWIATLPNAMEAAYREARRRKVEAAFGQQAAQATQQASTAQKAAARITSSTAGPRLPQQKSPDEQIVESIFGPPGKEKGIFDD